MNHKNMEEKVLLRIKTSAIALAIPLDWLDAYRTSSVLLCFPWRSFILALGLLGAWAVALLSLEWPILEQGWIPALVLGLGLCASEVLNRADVLTSEGLRRQSGIFGRKVIFVPYSAIQYVSVEVPRFGNAFNTGDVIVRADGRHHILVGVRFPYDVASTIEEMRRVCRSAEQEQPANQSLHRTPPAAL